MARNGKAVTTHDLSQFRSLLSDDEVATNLISNAQLQTSFQSYCLCGSLSNFVMDKNRAGSDIALNIEGCHACVLRQDPGSEEAGGH